MEKVRYKRGIKGAAAQILPPISANLKFQRDVKPQLKALAIEFQVGLFANGGVYDHNTKETLGKTLQRKLVELGLDGKVKSLAEDYIWKNYRGPSAELQFKGDADGAEFLPKGTTLKNRLIRSRRGAVFQLPKKITPKYKKQLQSLGFPRVKDDPLLSDNTGATVRIGKRVRHDSKEVVAAKIIDQAKSGRANAGQEQEIYEQLADNPHISVLRETATVGGKQYLFMDLAPYGDGHDVQQRIAAMADGDKKTRSQRTLARQYVEAVIAIHSQDPPIQHLDIKPANFLLKQDGTLILTDFEMSRTDNKFGSQPDGETILPGTLGFAEPSYKHKDANGESADLYSLGATLLSLSGINPPIKFGGYSRTDSLPGETLDQVAKKLMDADPANRPSLKQVLRLPYFRDGHIFTNPEFAEHVKPRD
jgi:serine/threonine protein kinase